MDTERTQSASYLDELLLKTSRTFALSIPLLPEPTREQVAVAYLLFRIADTLEDATRWAPDRQVAELNRFGALLRRPSEPEARELAASWTDDPPLEHDGYLELLSQLPYVQRRLLAQAPEAREQIVEHTLRTIERMASFVRRKSRGEELQLRDVPDLQAYCYAVAGIVGEMLTELFLLDRESLEPIAPALRNRAATFGEALQLVNILKDCATDVVEGRSYLPAGTDRVEVFSLARRDLREAGSYVRELQRAGAPRGLVEFTALPVLLAWATLDRVESEGPGAKLSRGEVAGIVQRMHEAIDRGQPAVAGD